MKTIARNRSSMFTTILVLGGLAAFYYYRRQGGKISPLLARGTDFVRTAREKITSMAPSVDTRMSSSDDLTADSMTSSMNTGVTSRSRAHEIPMAPEDMDRFPAT